MENKVKRAARCDRLHACLLYTSSSSLQEAAGERMRSILAAVTKNPVMGVLAGAFATAVLQSSSATTVMVIGFVSARLMGCLLYTSRCV